MSELMRKEKLEALVDWMVLRQVYPERRITVVCWAAVNWPSATDTDIDYLWENLGHHMCYQ